MKNRKKIMIFFDYVSICLISTLILVYLGFEKIENIFIKIVPWILAIIPLIYLSLRLRFFRENYQTDIDVHLDLDEDGKIKLVKIENNGETHTINGRDLEK